MLETLAKCEEEDCKLVFLRSMGNSGDPKFLEAILDSIEKQNGSAMLGFTAAQALRRIPITSSKVGFLEIALTLSQTSPGFLCICSTSLLKTLWEKEKLLVTSNLSFSCSVFYQFRGFFTILYQI